MSGQIILSMAVAIKDPYESLHFEPDMENGGRGSVQVGNYKWDREKSNDNIEKHGLSFYAARLVYDDTYHWAYPDTKHGQGRRHVVGNVLENPNDGLLLVVDVLVENDIRNIISAWVDNSSRVWDGYLEHKRSAQSKNSHFNRMVNFLYEGMKRICG